MISETLCHLKDAVNEYLGRGAPGSDAESDLGRVVFIESDSVDRADFKLGAVSLLLVNVEQEHALRPADPYRRVAADGSLQKTHRTILLNLHLLFAARFKDYKQGLAHISQILQFFMAHPALDRESSPTLPVGIEKLTMELMTLSLAEQNNLWSVLRTAYQPSLLYRARMVVFQQDDSSSAPPITDIHLGLRP